ncbi:MAG: aminotransferase class I/II-fold pyridoxal phosphate-dependent enzyme [Pirellulales bacterium]
MQHDPFPGRFFGPPTLVDLLRHRAHHQGNEHSFAFLTDGENEEVWLTNAELDRQARAIGAWLQSMGMQGQRAVLLYPAGLEFIAAFFGCLYGGVIAVPAYPPRLNRSLGRIEAIVADAEAKVAMTTSSVLERVQPMLEQTPDLKALNWLATDNMPTAIESQWKDPEVTGRTLAFLQYTSGSTGTPKGVMLSHSNLLHNSELIAHCFEHVRSGSGVFWLPSYHDMGLIGGVLQPLYVGRPNVIMSPMSFLQKPLRWLKAITKYRACTSGGPNFAYDLCVRKIPPEARVGLDLSSWSVAFNGAEPIRPETIEQFCEAYEPYGFRREAFYPCYGLAEATLIVSGGYKLEPPVIRAFDAKGLENRKIVEVAGTAKGARRLVGNGQNLPDQRVVIANPDTLAEAKEGEVGEIWVMGPSIAQGYWNRREETERTFQAKLADTGEGPFLRTGDLGFIQRGEVFCTGRLKDLIIVHGLNHYPQDIEQTVEQCHTALRPGAGAAFTIENERGQRLILVQEVERGEKAEAANALDTIRRAVSREHDLAVDAIVLVKAGSIPKTSSNKIQRHACRQEYLDGTLSVVAQWPAPLVAGELAAPKSAASAGVGNGEPAKPVSNRASTADVVLEAAKSIAGDRGANATIDSTFGELGLDSLERIELQATLEERFGGRLPEDLGPELENLREVAEAVDTYLGQPRKPAKRVPLEEIAPENYRLEKFPEYVRLRNNLDMLSFSGLGNPYFNAHERVTKDTTVIGGRELINFSSYNYIGMSGDPAVTKAAQEAVARYGTSVSASRLVSGEKVLHRELEQAIAEFVGTEDAIVFVGGHSTNETTLGHLLKPGDLILHDALAHNSIQQGAKLSGARTRAFPHNDWQALEKLLVDLRPEYRRVLVAIEGVYSMDGDIADLPKFIEVKQKHKALLFVDEAHSIGVLGRTGRGIGEHFDVDPGDVDLWMGTMSKSFGSCGGYIAGSKAVVEYLKYTAPGFVYSVGLSPSNAAAALASIRLLRSEPGRVERLHQRAELFLKLASERGLNTGLSAGSSVVPVILGNSLHCLQLSRALFERGINVQPILHPAVEESAARLRFFITSDHQEDQIRRTVEAVSEELAKINPDYKASAKQPGGARVTA